MGSSSSSQRPTIDIDTNQITVTFKGSSASAPLDGNSSMNLNGKKIKINNRKVSFAEGFTIDLTESKDMKFLIGNKQVTQQEWLSKHPQI